ncbi:MAG: hypothetical protein WBW33_22035, partial [Bryobacteraceae bacterium]
MDQTRAPQVLILTAILCLAIASQGYCQGTDLKIANFRGPYGPSKFENGFQIFWRNTAGVAVPEPSDTDPDAPVAIFDRSVNQLVTCRVAQAMRAIDPVVSGVAIDDVSVRKPGFIAVAAVYTRKRGNPVAVLLYFDWNGSPLRKIVLDTDAESLKIDNARNVWTLNGFDPANRAKSVFTEFDQSGAVIGRFLQPRRHWSTIEGVSKGGQTSFGLTSGRIWAWLPESRTLILADDHTGEANIHRTGLPSIAGGFGVYAREAILLPDGQFLMDVGWQAPQRQYAGWFIWSRHSGWKRLNAPKGVS